MPRRYPDRSAERAAAAHNAVIALRAIARRVAGVEIAAASDASSIVIPRREAISLVDALRSLPNRAGDLALGLLNTHLGPSDLMLPVGKAWALIRFLKTAEHRASPVAQGEKAITPGALSGREALVLGGSRQNLLAS